MIRQNIQNMIKKEILFLNKILEIWYEKNLKIPKKEEKKISIKIKQYQLNKAKSVQE